MKSLGAQLQNNNDFLRIEKITKKYDDVAAVDGVSISIEKGKIFALLGASGCGKSTLLRMLAGFEIPTSGKIFLEGQDITAMPPYERPINMMFQSYALFPHLTVWENIAFGLKRDGMEASKIEARVQAMLELTQLKQFVKRKPHQLSGGQQQRVALARSLAKQPKLLLLDEPLGALDKKLREQTQIELVNIIDQVGVTCVMVTHDQEEAMTMADRIAVMKSGSFLQVGPPTEIYETPNSKYVADFIGNVNLFEGTLDTDEPDHCIIGGKECQHYVPHGITGTQHMPVTVAIRPEKICVQRHLPTADQREHAAEHGYNFAKGKIKNRSYMGSYTVYHVLLDSGMTVKVVHTNAARHEENQLTWDDEAYVWWDGSDVVVLIQ
ncbi:MAG: ABC transporter ATP-binding protein [Burkholderiaceae bacterium]